MADDECKPLTNGRGTPNGTGLTSGPGLVNGLGYTGRDTRERERPEGLHLFPAVTSEVNGHERSGGMRVTRDLINGFAIEPSEGPIEPPGGMGPFGMKARARHRRLAELADRSLPGEDG